MLCGTCRNVTLFTQVALGDALRWASAFDGYALRLASEFDGYALCLASEFDGCGLLD